MLLAACGQKYEDNRIEMSNWPNVKPTTPFGQVMIEENIFFIKELFTKSSKRFRKSKLFTKKLVFYF
jgi:hypothetical protein